MFGDPRDAGHDEVDPAGLGRAVERDAGRVHDLIGAGLAAHDERAARALRVLGELDHAPADAADRLRSVLPAANGHFRVQVGLALHFFTGDEACIAEVAAVLTGTGNASARAAAATALGSAHATPQALGALHRGVTDDDHLVRRCSADALLRHAGEEPGGHDDLRTLLAGDSHDHRAAASWLLDLLARDSSRSYGTPSRFAVDLGPADHHGGYRRPARITLAGVVLGHARTSAYVPELRNLGINTTYPDREPDFAALRETLVSHGYTGMPEEGVLDIAETRAVLDACETTLDADLGVFRWRRHDLLFGDRAVFAVELGPVDPDGSLRICTAWVDGHNVSPVDNEVYVPQFAHSLRSTLRTLDRGADFLDWGPTTDHVTAELLPTGIGYELHSAVPGVGERTGTVEVSRDDIAHVLDATATALENHPRRP